MTKTLQNLRRAPRLQRTFVRTADPRCPLVAVWTIAAGTPNAGPQADDPSIAWPVAGRLLDAARRAFHRALTRAGYALA